MLCVPFVQDTDEAIPLRGKQGTQCPQPCRNMMEYFDSLFSPKQVKQNKVEFVSPKNIRWLRRKQGCIWKDLQRRQKTFLNIPFWGEYFLRNIKFQSSPLPAWLQREDKYVSVFQNNNIYIFFFYFFFMLRTNCPPYILTES